MSPASQLAKQRWAKTRQEERSKIPRELNKCRWAGKSKAHKSAAASKAAKARLGQKEGLRKMNTWLFITLVFTVVLHAEAPRQFRVKLSVTTSAESRITSLIGRELRDLKDVVVVTQDEAYTLSVIGMNVYSKNGILTGYALAVQFSQSLDLEKARKALASDAPQLSETKAQVAFADLYLLPGKSDISLDFLVFSGSDIEKTSKEIVAKFDTNILNPRREWSQFLKDRAVKAAAK